MLIIFWSAAPAPAGSHTWPTTSPPSRSPSSWPRPLYYSLQHFYELWSAFPLLGAHHILMCRITRQQLSGFFLFFKLFSRDLQFVILAGNLIGLPQPVWQLKTPARGLNVFCLVLCVAFAHALALARALVLVLVLTLVLSLYAIAPGTGRTLCVAWRATGTYQLAFN